MTLIAKKYAERLSDIKKSVQQAREYFQDNVDRYNEFMKFVFHTTLTEDEVNTLRELGKPQLEFNILEAYVSRLRGEFAKQQPSLTVRAADGVQLSQLDEEFTETIKVVEGHLRALFCDSASDKFEYDVYTDLLAGGFSVAKVYTEYTSEMSFEQKICVDRVFDVTLCGFDPMARKSHKGDGKYCFELYPMERKQFEELYGEEATVNMRFVREFEGFSWSFKNEEADIILVCDYYEKKKKREKIIKLANGHTVLERDYKKFLETWEAQGHIEQPPMPVPGNERWTEIETICRYRVCEAEVLQYDETDFKFLPLIFIDGNSVMLENWGYSQQMTRPFCYQAKGIQRLKGFAGVSLANEIENTVQHKFIVPIEAIPTDYLEAYQNVQKADTLVYNHFLDSNNPNITIPPPREVVRTPIPPEISQAFSMSDDMTQTILGTYDNGGIQNANQSGVAIARSAIQSNSAAVPYLVGYIKGLNRIAQVVVDLIPKYYRTPRSLPILLPSGKRSYEEVNKHGSLYLNYDPNSLQVNVETGVNFAMQKELALQTILNLMQASPLFAQFMNQYGLQILLDNIDIRGVEELKVKAEQFQQQVEQQQQAANQAQQQQQQMEAQKAAMEMAAMQRNLQTPTPEQLGLMSLQEQQRVDDQKGELSTLVAQEKAEYDAGILAIKEREAETKFLEVMAKIKSSEVDAEVKMAQAEAENTRSAVNLMIETSKHEHDTMMDVAKHDHEREKHQHEVEQANKPEPSKE